MKSQALHTVWFLVRLQGKWNWSLLGVTGITVTVTLALALRQSEWRVRANALTSVIKYSHGVPLPLSTFGWQPCVLPLCFTVDNCFHSVLSASFPCHISLCYLYVNDPVNLGCFHLLKPDWSRPIVVCLFLVWRKIPSRNTCAIMRWSRYCGGLKAEFRTVKLKLAPQA